MMSYAAFLRLRCGDVVRLNGRQRFVWEGPADPHGFRCVQLAKITDAWPEKRATTTLTWADVTARGLERGDRRRADELRRADLARVKAWGYRPRHKVHRGEPSISGWSRS